MPTRRLLLNHAILTRCNSWTKHSLRRLLSIVILTLSCVAAFAQNNVADSLYLDSIYRHLELEEFTISARVKEKDIIIPQTLSGVQLKKMNALSVADAIRYFSGVQIKDYGGDIYRDFSCARLEY